MRTELRNRLAWIAGLAVTLFAGAAFGQEAEIAVEEIVEEVETISAGDTAWMLTSTALVLMMTLPGLPSSTAAWFGARTSSRS